MKLRIRLTLWLISMLVVTGCTSMPLTTMWKMSKLDPFEMNPHDISIAVVTDKAVKFGKDAVEIKMTYKTKAAKTASVENFVGQISDDISTLSSADQKQLSGYQKANDRISIFSLDDKTAKAMRALQNKIRTLKNNNVDGSGSLAVGIKDVCISNPEVDTLNTHLLIKFKKNESYVLLVNGADLLKVLPQQKVTKQELICK